MTSVVFEVATIADAIRKAERVAPRTGQAFDKAAGIVFDIAPATAAPVVVRATNLDVYSMEWVDVLEADGEATSWRMPSGLLAAVVGSLPIGSGKTVKFQEVSSGHHSQVVVTSGRMTAKFNLMRVDYYPEWGAFDPDRLAMSADIGGRIQQVEWAAGKGEPPINGLHMDGERILATDRYRLAMADLPIPGLEEPITVPAGVLGSVLKQVGDIRIGVDGEQLLIMPDEHSQFRVIMYGVKYPGMGKVINKEFSHSIEINRNSLTDVMKRASNFSGAERDPMLTCYLGKEEFAVMLTNDEVGLLGDVVEIPGQAEHDRFKVCFTPKNIIDPIEKAPSDKITLHYNYGEPKAPFKIDGGSGYIAFAMPRSEGKPQQS